MSEWAGVIDKFGGWAVMALMVAYSSRWLALQWKEARKKELEEAAKRFDLEVERQRKQDVHMERLIVSFEQAVASFRAFESTEEETHREIIQGLTDIHRNTERLHRLIQDCLEKAGMVNGKSGA